MDYKAEVKLFIVNTQIFISSPKPPTMGAMPFIIWPMSISLASFCTTFLSWPALQLYWPLKKTSLFIMSYAKYAPTSGHLYLLFIP